MKTSTRIVNPTDRTQSYSWFPYRRLHLAPGQVLKMDGDIYTHCLVKNPRSVQAMDGDITDRRVGIEVVMEGQELVKVIAPPVRREEKKEPVKKKKTEEEKTDSPVLKDEVFDALTGDKLDRKQDIPVDAFTGKEVDVEAERMDMSEYINSDKPIDMIQRPAVEPAAPKVKASRKARAAESQAAPVEAAKASPADPLLAENFNMMATR